MTPREAEEKAEAIIRDYGGDTEAVHSKLDDLLCEVLRQNGYYRLVYLFEQAPRWYA